MSTKEIGDLKLKGKLKRANKLAEDAAAAAGSVHEWLRPMDSGYLEAEGMERTWRFKQEEIKDAVEVGAARKAFDLRLPDLGPYQMDFDRSGRFMALAGAKGHLAMMDWQRSQLGTEIQVKEAARAVQFLHNHLFFAVAQRKYCYIYDKRGLEVHCLREHLNTNALAFLPHHFLLASIGDYGVLRYLDTTTGQLIAQHKTHLGPCSVMRPNPWNAVLALGHGNGRTTMWTPNLTKPVVSLLCHCSPVSALAVDVQGRHLVTAGVDKQVHVWDLRNTYRRLHSYLAFAPPCTLDISQKGMLAVGYGSTVQVWADALSRKQASPYMTHRAPLGTLESLRFCPFEDVLGIGAAAGVSTMLVPGSGEPCYDSFVADPFQTKSQRREQEVAHLLDKLQPEMIVLDPTAIAQVAREPLQVQKERRQEQDMVNEERVKAQREKNEAKTRMKGKNKPSKRYRKKQLNVIDDKRAKVLERMRLEGKRTAEHGGKGDKDGAGERGSAASVPRALQAFVRK